jgi:hypothetical protein
MIFWSETKATEEGKETTEENDVDHRRVKAQLTTTIIAQFTMRRPLLKPKIQIKTHNLPQDHD